MFLPVKCLRRKFLHGDTVIPNWPARISLELAGTIWVLFTDLHEKRRSCQFCPNLGRNTAFSGNIQANPCSSAGRADIPCTPIALNAETARSRFSVREVWCIWLRKEYPVDPLGSENVGGVSWPMPLPGDDELLSRSSVAMMSSACDHIAKLTRVMKKFSSHKIGLLKFSH